MEGPPLLLPPAQQPSDGRRKPTSAAPDQEVRVELHPLLPSGKRLRPNDDEDDNDDNEDRAESRRRKRRSRRDSLDAEAGDTGKSFCDGNGWAARYWERLRRGLYNRLHLCAMFLVVAVLMAEVIVYASSIPRVGDSREPEARDGIATLKTYSKLAQDLLHSTMAAMASSSSRRDAKSLNDDQQLVSRILGHPDSWGCNPDCCWCCGNGCDALKPKRGRSPKRPPPPPSPPPLTTNATVKTPETNNASLLHSPPEEPVLDREGEEAKSSTEPAPEDEGTPPPPPEEEGTTTTPFPRSR